MKKSPIFTLIIFLLLIYPAHSLEITVGVYDNPPMLFYSNGKPDGFFIELLEYIAEKEEWELRYVYGTFPELIEKLKSGEIDILPDVAYTPEREEVFSFNREPVFNNWGVIVAGKRIETITDLDGKKIAGVRQDIYFRKFRNLAKSFGIETSYVEVEGDYREVFEAVRTGEADAGIVSRIYGNLYAGDYGLKTTSVVFSPVELRFAGAKGSEYYLEKIDYHLAILKEDESSLYYSLIGKWTETTRTEVPYWVKYLAFATVLLGFLLGFREIYLKRELRKREHEIIRVNRLLEKILKINETIIIERDPEKLGLKTSLMLSEYRENVVMFSLNGEVMTFSDGKRSDPKDVYEFECIKSAMKRKIPLQIPPGFHPESCIHCKSARDSFGYAFPMVYGSEVKGLIFILTQEKLSSREIRILETLAGDMAYALHDFELERERNQILNQLEKNIRNMMMLVDGIRNPLTVIKGLTELKCREIYAKIEKEISGILRAVQEIEKGWIESEKLEKKFQRK